MSSRTLRIVLLVSLALNLSFIGAWGYSALVAGDKGGQGGVEALSEELGLSDAQHEALAALREAARERWRIQLGRGGNRALVVAGLSAESYDQEAIEGQLGERMATRASLIAQTMGELHAYLQTLDDTQRQAFLERAKERRFLRNLFGRQRKDRQN